MLITFRRYFMLQKHVIQSNPALFLWALYMHVTRSVEAVINKLGVFVNEDDFINSWRPKWTSLCIHRQSRCEKTRSGWALVAGMANIVLASNDNLGKISFCDFHKVKTSSGAIDKHLYSWISLSPVFVKLTCFHSRSCLPFSMELHGDWANSLVDAASFILFKLLACSL